MLSFNLSIYYTEVVKNIPTKKTSGPGVFTVEFYQTSKGEIILILQRILYQFLQKIRKIPGQLIL